ncbi:MAG: glycosyltransferase family 4 protein [Candidatus Amulumruptor caecigallinarius]|nr:glycosyltransferase family 4 protein [Candidatus Amulumruptor caecigallinarius]
MNKNPTLIHLISSNRWGGVQSYALDICSHFREQGWDVTAVTRDARVVDSRFSRAYIKLAHAPLRGFFDPASAFILAGMLRKIPAGKGIVHVHRYRDAFTALLAKRIAKRPDIRLISTRHYVRQGRNSCLFRRIYNKINAHIFVSQTSFDTFRAPWPDALPMPRENVHILHNSLNINPGNPAPEPDRGPVVALYYGALVKGKGIETIIDSLATLRNMKLRLRIAGQGNPDYLDILRRRAMNRGVMEMIDWKISPDIPDSIISDSHFAVLPSVEREAFGLQNLRVMAYGRPQICSSNGAQTEYLSNGETALFCLPADAHLLAEQMKRLATDPSLRKSIGEAAYIAYAANLAWPHFIRALTDIYLPQQNI